MRITSSGNVGIGTTSPSSELHIAGTTPQVTIGDSGAEDTSILFDGNAQDFYMSLDDSADDLVIGTGSTIGSNVKMVIENGGNVGIGETTPSYKLDVNGEIALDGALRARDATGIGLKDDAGNLGVWVEDGGDVGIGTISPISELHVAGITPKLTIGDQDAEDTSIHFYGNAKDFYIALDDSSDDLKIGTGSVIGANINMVFENNGNVGIGTGSADSELHVVGGICIDSGVCGGSPGFGDLWAEDNVSALSFTDRTPYPKNLKTAYAAVLSMEAVNSEEKDEQLNHEKLHPFVKSKSGYRNLSATVSAQNVVIKDLINKIKELEASINSSK